MVNAVTGSGTDPRVPATFTNVTRPERRSEVSTRELIEERIAQIERQVEDRTSKAPVQTKPVNRGVSFELKPEINMIQTLVFDRKGGDVIREIPSNERIQFVEQFRKQLSKYVGRQVDLQA